MDINIFCKLGYFLSWSSLSYRFWPPKISKKKYICHEHTWISSSGWKTGKIEKFKTATKTGSISNVGLPIMRIRIYYEFDVKKIHKITVFFRNIIWPPKPEVVFECLKKRKYCQIWPAKEGKSCFVHLRHVFLR